MLIEWQAREIEALRDRLAAARDELASAIESAERTAPARCSLQDAMHAAEAERDAALQARDEAQTFARAAVAGRDAVVRDALLAQHGRFMLRLRRIQSACANEPGGACANTSNHVERALEETRKEAP